MSTEIRCGRCGHLNPTANRYCGNCGNALAEKTVLQTASKTEDSVLRRREGSEGREGVLQGDWQAWETEGERDDAGGRNALAESAESAWLEGTRLLRRNMIRSLQEYQSGLAGWSERSLLARRRERMLSEVTEQYVRFLREEARLTSDAVLQAREAGLKRQLLELKARLYREVADMAGAAAGDIERIFQSRQAELASPEVRRAYAEFVMSKIMDLLDQRARGQPDRVRGPERDTP